MRGFPISLLLSVLLALPLAAQSPATAPAITLGPGTMGWEFRSGRVTLTAPPDPGPLTGLPVIDPKAEGNAALLLRRLWARGEAAGLAGVLYDNRDRGHSRMAPTEFPQLTPLRYGALMQERGLDYGLAGPVLLQGPVIGNSSTAVTSGALARSLPRMAMTTREGPALAWEGYAANRIYVYPEHRDHDDVDRFPANWPYMVISQGSSHSDRPFLRALAMTLAAFRPETRARLEAEGLVAPTLQMILRRTRAGSATAYLTGAAHPTVFDSETLKPAQMVSLANALAPGEIPPLVRIRVEAEDFADAAGPAGRSERFFDTPSAVARIWRGPGYSREMIVSAAETVDPNGRDLTFRWVLLRGDPQKVRITPRDGGARARIAIDWHDPFPIARIDGRMTSRVDIGIFAENGAWISAPAILSVSFPSHEARRWEAGPDGAMRLAEVDYDAIGRDVGFDPALHVSAPWRDHYLYGPDGEFLGWERENGGKSRRFAPDGTVDGRLPVYEIQDRGRRPELREVPEN